MTPDAHPPGLPAELVQILAEVLPGGGAFRHRQHLHLAFVTVRRYGTAGASARIGCWLRHLAAYERAPQKYHATVTRAWTELVGHHVAADRAVTDFALFAEQYPELLDKRLLSRHYSSATLASPRARAGWVAPDLLPFPWLQADAATPGAPAG